MFCRNTAPRGEADGGVRTCDSGDGLDNGARPLVDRRKVVSLFIDCTGDTWGGGEGNGLGIAVVDGVVGAEVSAMTCVGNIAA